MNMKNKKGFTLIELLSVIAIMAVLVLIATNAVLPAATNANKQVLASEANIIAEAAKSMYVNEGATGTKCYSYQSIVDSQYIDKDDENYSGSILIEVDAAGNYSYKVWLSNGTYAVLGKYTSIDSDDVEESALDASTTCSD